MAPRPKSLAGSRTVAAANRTGAASCTRSNSNPSVTAAGCAGTTAGVNRSTVAASEPSHGARTSTPASWSSAPLRSRTVDPARSASRQCFLVSVSVPHRKVKSTRSKASGPMAWMKVTSSPTWSNCPFASSSSSSTKVAAASGDSEMTSFSSRPKRLEAPAIAILYTGILQLLGILLESRRVSFRNVCVQGGIDHVSRPSPPPRPPVRRPRPDAGEHICEPNQEHHHVRVPQHDIQYDGHHHEHLERMTAGEVNLLARPEPPRAHHQEPGQRHHHQPRDRDPPNCHRNSVAEVNGRGQQSRRSRNRHPHKILSSRPARISWLRIVRDVEARQPRRSAQQEQKTDECASLHQVLPQLGID